MNKKDWHFWNGIVCHILMSIWFGLALYFCFRQDYVAFAFIILGCIDGYYALQNKKKAGIKS